MTEDRQEILDKYNDEVTRGKKAETAYNNFIGPFISEKELVCFEAFKETSVSNVEGLMETKRQLMALRALEVEITTIIDTGKMAAKAIAQLEREETPNEN